MGTWPRTFELPDATVGQPAFLRIARAIADEVRRGRLGPGARLPGSRELARSLGVHRNTALAAYRELAAEGWIATAPARGTYVSGDLPDRAPRPFARSVPSRGAMPARAGFDFRALVGETPAAPERHLLSLRGGHPDLRLVPADALARAYRRALRAQGRAALGYGDPQGHPRLREALATMLSATRGVAASADDVLVTRGSQMAFDLLARTLLVPGDVVVVESFGYRPAWRALELAGATLVSVPVDARGMDVEAVERVARARPVRAVYVTPHHQYPTTAVLAPGRRMALLELARARRIAVLEDDYDHEFHYEGRPVLPMASADRAGVVVYVGSLSKILAPGLRLGYVVAPRPLVLALTALRGHVDRQGDHVVEHAVAELLEDGEVQRHARRARAAYAERRDALAEALGRAVGDAVSFARPPGGTALWARVDPRIDVERWAARAREGGVDFQTGRAFTFDGRPRPFARFGFASLAPEELRRAVARLRAALRHGS
jgi:GntR family transcriptional regulator/MocR family aminotransferase